MLDVNIQLEGLIEKSKYTRYNTFMVIPFVNVYFFAHCSMTLHFHQIKKKKNPTWAIIWSTIHTLSHIHT